MSSARCHVLAILALFGVALGIYLPGLPGAFLLDDYSNLARLAWIEGGLSWGAFLSVAFGGDAGDLGRVLAYASFAPQHADWPGNPGPFKLVNILLHLFNGFLIVLVVLNIARLLKQPAPWTIGLLLGAAWLLHPLNVSTVLYTVQRMTELSALFMLAGLLAYLKGRAALIEGRPGYLQMTAGVIIGSALAVLSKENGALLPLYILMLESTLLRTLPQPKRYPAWKGLFLVLPPVVLTVYLGFRLNNWILPGYALRDYSLCERLLTESRVLYDYLGAILFPRPRDLGLFHDDFVISRGLLQPPGTALALFGLAALLALGLGCRKRYPLAGFAVLWFIAGHVLESTVIPLEIYFEHRNYLPMLGPLALAAGMLGNALGTTQARRPAAALGFVWLSILAGLTLQEARLWGSPVQQALVWAEQRPNSPRAQEWKGNILARAGQYREAADHFGKLARNEGFAAAYLSVMQAACYDDSIELPATETVADALRTIPYSHWPQGALEQIILMRENGLCLRLEKQYLMSFFAALRENPRFNSKVAHLLVLQARLEFVEMGADGALIALGKAYNLGPRVDLALLHVKWLVQLGQVQEAQRWLIEAEKINSSHKIGRRLLHEREITDWRYAVAKLDKQQDQVR